MHHSVKRYLLISAFFIFSQVPGHAQNYPLWYSLKAGPYQTGYFTQWKYDWSRSWGQIARPIRLSVWYPAQIAIGKPMHFNRYVHEKPTDKKMQDYADMLLAYDIGDSTHSLKGLFKGSETLYNNLLNTPVYARWNASFAKGKFPVIIYSLGQGDYNQENIVLWEFLASHGYIIIVVPQVGPSLIKRIMMIDQESCFETQVRDLEFALQQAAELPSADMSKVCAMGHSMGEVYGLLFAMQNRTVDLLIGLDGSFNASYASFGYKYWNARYYDPFNFKIPFVQLQREQEGRHFDHLDALKYADRYLVTYHDVVHADFNSYPLFTGKAPVAALDEYALSFRKQPEAIKAHISICNTVLEVLNNFFKGTPDQPLLTRDVERRRAIKAPNEEEFAIMVREKGVEQAVNYLEPIIKQYPADTLLREKIINRIAFEYSIGAMNKENVDILLAFCRLNPGSASAWAILGDAYQNVNNTAEAKKAYEYALKINPEQEHAKDALKKIMQK